MEDGEMKEYDYQKHFLNFSKEELFLFEKKSKHTFNIANNALENFIIPFPNFEAANFNNGFNWEIRNKKFGKSYQLYIQSLRVINDLLIAFENTNNNDYLLKSKEIIDSWIEYKNTQPNNNMIWYDHPAANRAQLIVQFLYFAARNLDIDYSTYIETLEDHLKVLKDDSIYNFNNHGLMMDKTLFVLGIALDRKDAFEHGLRRATETFWYNFSSNAIHLENSPEYHAMVTDIYRELQEFISNYNYSFSEYILEYLKQSDEYFDILVKPNGYLPQIGDSISKPHSLVNKKYKNLNDYESGMNILQRGGDKPVYITFIAGYSTQVHKHFDDLSITLNYNGHDFLVDPGKFNYSRSPLRNYVKSAKAHSTPFFSEYKYTRSNENRFTRAVRTLGYYHFEDYSIVSGVNESFSENTFIKRTIILLNHHDIVMVMDSTRSAETTKIIQNFNLDESVNISRTDKDDYILENKGVEISISQFISSRSEIINGENEEERAKNTVGFGKLTDTKQIQFHGESYSKERMNFITLINLNHHNITKFEKDNSSIEMLVDQHSYHINL